MKERIFKFIFGAGVLLSAMVVPGYSSSSAFTFNGSSSGTVGLNSSGFVTCIGTGCSSGTAVTFTTILPGDDPLTATLTENANSGIITLTATGNGTSGNGFNYTNITSGETLATITLLSATTTLANATSINGTHTVDIPFESSDLGSISVASNLLSDLGWSAGVLASFAADPGNSALESTNVAVSGNNSLTSNDITITLTSTPEPMSFVLFGSGLLGVGLLARRRSSQRVRQICRKCA
jgi:hypothetical protein